MPRSRYRGRVDLQERRQLDMAERMHKVRSKARAWRFILPLVLAAACLGLFGATHTSHSGSAEKVIHYTAAGAFPLLAMAAAFALSTQARSSLQPLVGDAHAGVVRYAIVLIGLFVALVVTLKLFERTTSQVLVGGAIVGVLAGIAAQQSLGNLFAGLVLMFARPFRVGDRVRFRSGSIGGPIEGTIVDISLAYVRVDTADGPTLVPNSQALSAATVLIQELPPEA
jgi:small-conductance mechanosensitive channel